MLTELISSCMCDHGVASERAWGGAIKRTISLTVVWYHLTTGPETMVGAELMAQMSTEESFYEEVIVKGQISPKRDVNCNLELSEDEVFTTMRQKYTQTAIMPNDGDLQDSENIYEVIPGNYAQQKCEHNPMIRSYSFGAKERTTGSIGKKTLPPLPQHDSSDTNESNLLLSCTLTTSRSNPDISSTQYAEIIHTNKVSDFIPSRPTRESENPLLRHDFSGNLSFLPNLRNLRKHLTEISQDRCLEREQRSAKTTPSTTPEPSRKPNEPVPNLCLSKSVSPKHSPQHSPRAKTSPGPIYVNMEFPPVENGDNHSRRSSASSRSSVSFNERHSLSSMEDGVFRDVDVPPYENIRDLFEGGRKREGSSPVDIVYSDLHFHGSRRPPASKPKLGKSASTSLCSSEPDKLKIEERSLSLPGQSNPNLPPPKKLLDDPRPKSRSLGKLNGGALGFYLARFVKSATVQRSNSKTLQSTLHDIVSKAKVEDCSSVNVEVTSDMMRISTNCSPWEVIASFDIENIGCIELYEQDNTTLGVIVCVPETEAQCYVVRCPDAQLIYSAVKNAFNSSNSKTFNVPVSTPVGPESWLGEEDVTTFTGISYLGSLKMKKTYLFINEGITSLLEKAHPREFQNIFLEVHPEEIRLIDTKDNKILHQHAIPWILKLGVYEEDPRLFGYIVSEARQGEKTRMLCHVFRCGRITSSVAATEAIRLGCQATYSERRDSNRARRISFISSSSNGSQEISSSPPRSATPDASFKEHEQGEKDTKQEKAKPKKKDSWKRNSLGLKRFSSMPHLIPRSTSMPHIIRSHSKKDKELNAEADADKTHPNLPRTASVSSAAPNDVIDSSWEIVEEKDYNFDVTYLCSTVVNPPLRPKHLRECVKQYQKQQAKALKNFGVDPSKEVELSLSLDGVKMTNSCAAKGEQEMFFPFSSVSHVMSHPESPEYFAFALVVTGDSKHKCHLFKQTKVPPSELIESFEAFR